MHCDIINSSGWEVRGRCLFTLPTLPCRRPRNLASHCKNTRTKHTTAGIYGPGRSILDSLAAAGTAAPSSSQRRRGRQRYISRTHAYDIGSVLLASMRAPGAGAGGFDEFFSAAGGCMIRGGGGGGAATAGGGGGGSEAASSSGGYVAVFNVADDEPAGREEVEAYARQLLGLPPVPPPPPDEAVTSSGGGGGGGEAGGSGGGGRGAALEEKRVGNSKMKSVLGVALRYPSYREGLAAIAGCDVAPFGGAGDVVAMTGRGGGGGEGG